MYVYIYLLFSIFISFTFFWSPANLGKRKQGPVSHTEKISVLYLWEP